MTINLTDKSTKAVLLTVASNLTKMAEKDKVDDRRTPMLAIAAKLEALAHGRYVTKLLDYME